MTARTFPSSAYLSLKAAFRQLTKIVGGQEAAASLTRVDFQRIGRYGRLNEPTYAPIDVVADLESDAGDPMVTRALAQMAGFILIPRPPVHGDPQWIAHLGAMGKEVGEAMARLSEALECDGTITAEEVQRLKLREEISDAMEVMAKIDKALERLVTQENHKAPAEVTG